MIEGLFQPIHLILILAIILIVFGAGKLPEMGGAVGRGIKEFRKEVHDATDSDPAPAEKNVVTTTITQTAPATTFCTNCGERMPATSKFCPNCGASMIESAAPEKAEISS